MGKLLYNFFENLQRIKNREAARLIFITRKHKRFPLLLCKHLLNEMGFADDLAAVDIDEFVGGGENVPVFCFVQDPV